MSIVIVSGALANKPGNAGGAWERMSWVVGLQRLGCDVWFIEQITPATCVDAAGAPCGIRGSVQLAWFRAVTRWFGIEHKSVLITDDRKACIGMPWSQLLELTRSAMLLVNLSGNLSLPALRERVQRTAYVDVDPGFTQFWHLDPALSFRVEPHDHYFTIAENIGKAGCPLPTCGIHWRTVRQPVVMEQWPFSPNTACERFTTVASWRGASGSVHANGRDYSQKAHEFRRFIEFPRYVPAACELALGIERADDRDLTALRDHGWHVADPRTVAGDPETFRAYVQQSGAEFSVAQGVYVDTCSGWFSDRSVRYLASGKPVLIQDTGLKEILPTGAGVVVFRTMDEAVAGAEAIANDYANHCRAARAIAAEQFDSDVVLGRFLAEVDIAP